MDNKDIKVVEAISMTNAMNRLTEREFSVAIVDLMLPNGIPGSPDPGFNIIRELVANHHCTAVLVISGVDDEAVIKNALALGANIYMVKGQFGQDEFQEEMHRAFEYYDTHKAIEEAKCEAIAQNESVNVCKNLIGK